jgi:hypothetical protein
MTDYKEYLDIFKRSISGKHTMWDQNDPFQEATMDNVVGNVSPTMSAQALAPQTQDGKMGPADLTPMKNKIEEARAALEEAMGDAEANKVDDARQGLLKAKAAIEQALGGISQGAGQ